MEQNKSLKVASVIFGIIALFQLLRFILGWNVKIENFEIPLWFSIVGVVIMGFLSYLMYTSK